MALQSGTPLVITGARGDTLQLELLGSSINDSGNIHLSIALSGSLHRGTRIATAKEKAIGLEIEATTEEQNE